VRDLNGLPLAMAGVSSACATFWALPARCSARALSEVEIYISPLNERSRDVEVTELLSLAHRSLGHRATL
jgi:hypothetical protein